MVIGITFLSNGVFRLHFQVFNFKNKLFKKKQCLKATQNCFSKCILNNFHKNEFLEKHFFLKSIQTDLKCRMFEFSIS